VSRSNRGRHLLVEPPGESLAGQTSKRNQLLSMSVEASGLPEGISRRWIRRCQSLKDFTQLETSAKPRANALRKVNPLLSLCSSTTSSRAVPLDSPAVELIPCSFAALVIDPGATNPLGLLYLLPTLHSERLTASPSVSAVLS
jgi:hypothetical protein